MSSHMVLDFRFTLIGSGSASIECAVHDIVITLVTNTV
jgi:hypothetical protein